MAYELMVNYSAGRYFDRPCQTTSPSVLYSIMESSTSAVVLDNCVRAVESIQATIQTSISRNASLRRLLV